MSEGRRNKTTMLKERFTAKKKLADASEAEVESPWPGVADWLRVAHSLLDDKTAELTRNAEQ